MEAHERLYSAGGLKTSYSTSHSDSPPGLELQSSNLTAGRDLYLNVNSGYGKQSLPDTRQLAHWLSSLNQHQFHKDVFDKVTPGTGEWVLSRPEFMDWLAGKINILWGTGIPGAGKTCLSSIIISHLIHRELKTVVFFYCQYKKQPSINEVLACLLKQMVESSEQAAQYVAMTLYASCARTSTRPSRSELSKTLHEMAQKFDNLFFVVDALDELPDDTRSDLVTELAALQYPLLVTSRPLPNLMDFIPIQLVIRPPDQDIYAFISAAISRVSKLRPFLRDDRLRAEIIKTIQNKCDGMFLLASLQIEALASAGIINARSLLDAVNRLPGTLDHQYKVTLERIQCQSLEERNLAQRAILWVTHATCYLEVEELLEALTVDAETALIDENQRTTEDTLVSVCLGLLKIEKETRTIRLIHFTAQEYFESQKSSLFKSPHAYIANVCAIYLNCVQVDCRSFTSHEELLGNKLERPLTKYSCYNLGHHTYCATAGTNRQLPTYVTKLFTERGHAPISLQPLEDQIDFGNAIHFAAAHDLVSLFEENVDAIDHESLLGCTPLFYACLAGHSRLAKRILAQNQANLSCKTVFNATTLHAAVQSGNMPVIKLLLSMGRLPVTSLDVLQNIPGVSSSECPGNTCVDINAQMSDGRTALYIASGEGNLPAVEALLRCANVDTMSSQNFGSTPLHISSLNGHEEVVRLLLKCSRIDVNAQDCDGWTPLHHAAYSGHESVIRLLLRNPGVDIHKLTKEDITPLHCAVQGRNNSILELLLMSPGIKINARDIQGLTPLHFAAYIGHEPAVRLLLSFPGVEISPEDNDGLTPLHNATANGHISAIRVLLRSPWIDVNAKSADGQSILHLATVHGDDAVVRLLLEYPRIDVNAETSCGWTPLHLAAYNGRESIARLLLNTPGINIHATSEYGITPLHSVIQCRNNPLVKLFMKLPDININAKDIENRTPLHYAAGIGNESATRLLLASPGVEISAEDRDGFTPLLIAAKYCHISVLQLLLQSPDVYENTVDSNGYNLIHYAAARGHEAIVQAVQKCPGMDLNARISGGWAPLHLAALFGHEGVVKLLLCSPVADINTYIEVDIRCNHGGTPLSLSSEYGHANIVRILLNSTRVNINNIDNDGDTPLMCAAYNGHTSVARLLLGQPEIQVNIQDKEHRRTALSKACDASKSPAEGETKTEGEAYPFIALLLAHKDIKINLADNEGKTPLYYASRSGFQQAVELLEGRGAVMQDNST